MTNFQAYKERVVIYIDDTDSPLDISRQINAGWNIKSTELSIEGWVGYTAELVLHVHPDGEELDNEINELRWKDGNRVTIEVFVDGAWIKVRTLRTIAAFYNYKDRTLKLQLGCKFVLRDVRLAPGDSSPVQVSGGVSIGSWLDDSLSYFGLPARRAGRGDPTLSELIYGSMPYQGGSKIMEHIGKAVYGSSGCYIDIDANEEVRVTALNFTPTAAAMTLHHSECEPFERGDGSKEKIPGRVRVLCNPQYVKAYQPPPDITTVTVTGPLTRTETVSESFFGNIKTVTTSGTETITGISVLTSSTSGKTIGGPYRVIHTEEYGGARPLIPNPDPDLPGTPATTGFLVKETDRTEQTPDATTTAGGTGTSIGMRVAKETITDYEYYTIGLDGLPSVTTKAIRKTNKTNPVGFNASSGSSNTGGNVLQNTDLLESEEYDRLPDGTYRYRKTTIDPNVEETDRRSTVITSSPGSSEPPGTRFRPSPYSVTTKEWIGIKRIAYPAGAPVKDYPRDFNLGQYVHSKETATLRATELIQMLIGRHRVHDIGFRPTAAFLTEWRPCQIAYVQVNDTTDDVFIIDGSTLMLQSDRSYIATEGVKIGTRDRATGVLTRPFDDVVTAIATPTNKVIRRDGRILIWARG